MYKIESKYNIFLFHVLIIYWIQCSEDLKRLSATIIVKQKLFDILVTYCRIYVPFVFPSHSVTFCIY